MTEVLVPEVVQTLNPATGERLASYPAQTGPADLADLDAARSAYAEWSAVPLAERLALLRRVGGLLTERRAQYAALITREMGKPLVEARAEVEKCATTCDFYADNAAAFLADEQVATSADRSWISYEPVGIVLAVMPWNFPLWQVLRFAAPALMAGNAALLKHSPNTTGCAVAVQRIVTAAGAPEGLFVALVVAEADVPAVTRRLIADPRIGAVTITGSERAGRAVGAAAGDAIKKSVLELGGSDAFVVLADADLPRVAALAARGRLMNAGQSCISPKRLIVDASVAEEFTRLLVAEVEALVVGDPEAPGTHVGPMARADLRDGVHRQVEASVEAGARLLTGGRPLEAPGASTPRPCSPGSPPASGVARGDLRPGGGRDRRRRRRRGRPLANDTRFGLGASVWTTDADHGVAVARRIRSGAAFVNALVASDPRLPFGGTGQRLRPRVGRCGDPRVRQRPHGLRRRPSPPSPRRWPGHERLGRGRGGSDTCSITSASMSPTSRPWSPGTPRRWTWRSSSSSRCRSSRSEARCWPAGRPPDRAAGPRWQPARSPGGQPVEAALTRGYSHFALDVADVDASYAALIETGATDRMSPRPSPEPGVRMAYVAGPEGNLIELLDRTAAYAGEGSGS